MPVNSHTTPERVTAAGETSCNETSEEARERYIAFGRKLKEEARRVSRSTMSRTDPHLVAWVDDVAVAAVRMSGLIRCEHKMFDRGSGARGSRGWVYVVHAPAVGLAKIGYTSTSTLEKRIRTIAGYAPTPLSIVALASGGTQLEALWHQQYKTARRHLEWFDASVVVPVFSDAMDAAPADGCARCVLLGDRVQGWRRKVDAP
jgi:hypothetical protein